jgi:hypothetical protein
VARDDFRVGVAGSAGGTVPLVEPRESTEVNGTGHVRKIHSAKAGDRTESNDFDGSLIHINLKWMPCPSNLGHWAPRFHCPTSTRMVCLNPTYQLSCPSQQSHFTNTISRPYRRCSIKTLFSLNSCSGPKKLSKQQASPLALNLPHASIRNQNAFQTQSREQTHGTLYENKRFNPVLKNPSLHLSLTSL